MSKARVTKAELEEKIEQLHQQLAEMDYAHGEKAEAAAKKFAELEETYKQEIDKLKKQLAATKKKLKDKDDAVKMDLVNKDAVWKDILKDKEAEHKKHIESKDTNFVSALAAANGRVTSLKVAIARLAQAEITAQLILDRRGLHWNELKSVVEVIKAVRAEGAKK
jgi:DNA repair exonuclease SbcCD ATPase subunit